MWCLWWRVMIGTVLVHMKLWQFLVTSPWGSLLNPALHTTATSYPLSAHWWCSCSSMSSLLSCLWCTSWSEYRFPTFVLVIVCKENFDWHGSNKTKIGFCISQPRIWMNSIGSMNSFHFVLITTSNEIESKLFRTYVYFIVCCLYICSETVSVGHAKR